MKKIILTKEEIIEKIGDGIKSNIGSLIIEHIVSMNISLIDDLFVLNITMTSQLNKDDKMVLAKLLSLYSIDIVYIGNMIKFNMNLKKLFENENVNLEILDGYYILSPIL